MPESSSDDLLPKAAFVFSLATAAFLYGFASHGFGLFPNDVIETGWRQYRVVKQGLWEDGHTATKPRIYDRQGTRTLDSAAVQQGFTLIPSIWEDFDWRPGLKLIDADGEVVHKWEADPARIFPDQVFGPLGSLMQFNEPKNSYLFPNGDVLVLLDEMGTARLDACGRVEWRVAGNHHHSLTRAEDGTFWVSGREAQRAPDPITGLDSVRHDLLVHLSAEGEVLEEIKVFDIIRHNRGLLRRHFRFRPEDTHLNDIDALPTSMAERYPLFDGGDLLVSLRHLNVVLVVDPQTLDVEWWTGKPFILQHDPDFMGSGWIGVFDNNNDGTKRGTRFGGARVVGVQPHTDSISILFESSQASRLFTKTRGNWQLLENGNLLMTESNAGRVVEVGPDGRLVWEWIQEPYSGSQVPSLSRAQRYEISRRQVRGWPCH